MSDAHERLLVDHTGTTRSTARQAGAMARAIEDGVELSFTSTPDMQKSPPERGLSR